MTWTRMTRKAICCGILTLCGLVWNANTASAIPMFDLSQELIAVTEVTPGNFSFTQGGFTAGGLITGTFSGVDADADGQLSSFFGEVSDFSAAFSGNALVPAFTLGFFDLFGLVYDLNGGPLGDGITLDVEGILAISSAALYVAGPGPFDVCGIGVDCAQVAVPEPAMFLLGATGFAAWLQRRRLTALL